MSAQKAEKQCAHEKMLGIIGSWGNATTPSHRPQRGYGAETGDACWWGAEGDTPGGM